MNTRSEVIERGVELEFYITTLLCKILKIDEEKSLILGYKSGAMTLNSKIGLLQELNITSKEVKDSLEIFIRIRNKFAHVQEVNSFSIFFEKYGKDQKNKFMNYGKLNGEVRESEEYFLLCFRILCLAISTFATDTLLKIIADEKRETIIKNVIEKVSTFSVDKDLSPEKFIFTLQKQLNEINISK
jgi:hypothetical protein